MRAQRVAFAQKSTEYSIAPKPEKRNAAWRMKLIPSDTPGIQESTSHTNYQQSPVECPLVAMARSHSLCGARGEDGARSWSSRWVASRCEATPLAARAVPPLPPLIRPPATFSPRCAKGEGPSDRCLSFHRSSLGLGITEVVCGVTFRPLARITAPHLEHFHKNCSRYGARASARSNVIRLATRLRRERRAPTRLATRLQYY
jgi:hypothetical protein